MPTSYTSRSSVTTSYTSRPSISGFQSYTWANAPDNWATAVWDWDSYWITVSWTQYTWRSLI